MRTGRPPVPSGASAVTCMTTPPVAGTSSGACNVRSSTAAQPTASPARTASSTKAAPGRIATPATA